MGFFLPLILKNIKNVVLSCSVSQAELELEVFLKTFSLNNRERKSEQRRLKAADRYEVTASEASPTSLFPHIHSCQRARDRRTDWERERERQRERERHTQTERERQTHRLRERERDRHTHWERERHTHRLRERQTHTLRERERDTHTERERETDTHTHWERERHTHTERERVSLKSCLIEAKPED